MSSKAVYRFGFSVGQGTTFACPDMTQLFNTRCDWIRVQCQAFGWESAANTQLSPVIDGCQFRFSLDPATGVANTKRGLVCGICDGFVYPLPGFNLGLGVVQIDVPVFLTPPANFVWRGSVLIEVGIHGSNP